MHSLCLEGLSTTPESKSIWFSLLQTLFLRVVSSPSFQDGCPLGPLPSCSVFLRIHWSWRGLVLHLLPILPGWAFIRRRMISQPKSPNPSSRPKYMASCLLGPACYRRAVIASNSGPSRTEHGVFLLRKSGDHGYSLKVLGWTQGAGRVWLAFIFLCN